MGEIAMDISTGFIPEDELLELAEVPDDLAAAGSTFSCIASLISALSAISAAFGQACPTTACTSRCTDYC